MSHSLDHFGHHAMSCKKNETLILTATKFGATFFQFCQGAQLKAGNSLGHGVWQMHPVYILIPTWELGKPAAIDLN